MGEVITMLLTLQAKMLFNLYHSVQNFPFMFVYLLCSGFAARPCLVLAAGACALAALDIGAGETSSAVTALENPLGTTQS